MIKKTTLHIIEDDHDAKIYLKNIVSENFNNIEIVGISDSVEASIESIKKTSPEIVLMDIILPDGDAFAILDAFSEPAFEVIFISAHGEYLEKALEYYALNFLTKPIDSRRLIRLLDRYTRFKKRMFEMQRYEMLKEIVQENGKKFLLHAGSKHIAIKFSDIIRCEAEGNYTLFYLTGKKKHLVSKPLGYYCDLLEGKDFFRISRFNLINLRHINHIYKKETIILSNNDKVNVSKRNRSKLIALITDLSL